MRKAYGIYEETNPQRIESYVQSLAKLFISDDSALMAKRAADLKNKKWQAHIDTVLIGEGLVESLPKLEAPAHLNIAENDRLFLPFTKYIINKLRSVLNEYGVLFENPDAVLLNAGSQVDKFLKKEYILNCKKFYTAAQQPGSEPDSEFFLADFSNGSPSFRRLSGCC